MRGCLRDKLLLAIFIATIPSWSAAQETPLPSSVPPPLPLSSEFAFPRPSEPGDRPLEALENLTGTRASEPPEMPDEIESDRNAFTPATSLTPRGKFILEIAYSYIDNRGYATNSFPEGLLRYGLTDRIELRLGWNAEIGGSSDDVSGSTGESDLFSSKRKIDRDYTLDYGVKLRVTEQDGWVPRSILILEGNTPTGGSPGISTASSFFATYAAGWVFQNRWQFDTSLRYGLDSENATYFSQWAPSTVLRVPLGDKLAVHVEYFGLFSSGKMSGGNTQFFSPGFRYLITSDLEIGGRVGWGLNEQSPRFFSNVGIGWRF